MSPNSHKGPQILYQHGALSPGAEVWVIPERTKTPWSLQLDWYLNFQLSRAATHKSPQISQTLKSIIEDFELNLPTSYEHYPQNRLMIACEKRLPCSLVICVNDPEDSKLWLNEVHSLWQQLHEPTLRVFLPNEFPVSQISSLWPSKNVSSSLTFVPSTMGR